MLPFVPLLTALGYAVAALLLKRALQLGAGEWRTLFISNLAMGVCFSPLWFFEGHFRFDLLWQPVAASILFFLGQLFTFLAIGRGDVSVATPVMGCKAVFVAFFAVFLFHKQLSVELWIGAALTAVAVTLLGSRSRGETHHRHVGRTVIYAALSAASFALTDVIVSFYAPDWGVGKFVPLIFNLVALYSFSFVPFFRKPLRATPAASWPWLIWGSILLAVQASGMALCLAITGRPTEVNIVYNSRGIFSVVIVWIVGHWFHSTEQHLGSAVLSRRLAGSVLLLIAIILILK